MRRTILALTILAAGAAASPLASAVTCYQILDANDNVVYQDIFPPIDLSDQGAAERKAMRARNEHMIALESDRCPRLELVVGPGTASRINIEEMGEPTTLTSKPPSDAPQIQRSGKATPAKSAPPKAPAKPATAN